MAPQRFSRYTFSNGFVDPGTGAFMIEDVEPVVFQDRIDNRTYVVKDGDTLFHIATRMFPSYARASGLWWVIADFQPDAPMGIGQVINPTLPLPVGATIYAPSEQFLEDEVFNEKRRTEVDS